MYDITYHWYPYPGSTAAPDYNTLQAILARLGALEATVGAHTANCRCHATVSFVTQPCPDCAAKDAELERLRTELAMLKVAVVRLAIPYEALLLDRKSRKWIEPTIWQDITEGVYAAREAIAGGKQ